MVKFNSVSLVITDRDEESASVVVVFDPPVPEDITEQEFEHHVQPCTALAFMLLQELEKSFTGDMEQVSSIPHTLQ